ncbi:uncharacterized protein O8D03_013203 [Erethizon dorsatum]
MKNFTEVTAFVLRGFTDDPELQLLLFLLFLAVYLFTLLGNLGLIVLVTGDSRLHNPMYYFLSVLSFVDACYSSVITPNMLVDFVSEKKAISFLGCAAQMFLAVTCRTTECFLLAAMAYDRYVAIHNQLLYPVSMTPGVCVPLIVASFLGGILHATVHTVATFSLSFCGPNVIQHIFCDVPALLAISCSDTHTNQLLLFYFAGSIEIFTVVIILISYGFILSVILRTHSAEGRRKVFSTCGSHLTVVSIFHGSFLFMYMRPSSSYALEHDMVVSIFYTIVIAALNPIIYSLRNKDVKEAMQKVFGKNQLMNKIYFSLVIIRAAAYESTFSTGAYNLGESPKLLSRKSAGPERTEINKCTECKRRVTKTKKISHAFTESDMVKHDPSLELTLADLKHYTMGRWNSTNMPDFILMGLADSEETQLVLFLLFLLIYLVTVLGNAGMILIIRLDPQLHTPMYFFLTHLSFLDLSYSSVITPKTLQNLLTSTKSISFLGCFTQMFFFILLGSTECFLLSTMAYDRYVAICKPLLYPVIMSARLCHALLASSYTMCFMESTVNAICLSRLHFCNSNVVHHFFCDTSPILALSCSDTYEVEIIIFIFAGSTLIVSLITISGSYVSILYTILKINSTAGKRKAFSTCASHLLGVTIFYSTTIFAYLKPKESYSLGKDQVASVFYTIVIPMLNPLIYSLRNKEVKNALLRVLPKKEGCSQLK